MKSDEEIIDMWIEDFKNDYNETPEAIDWYIQTVTSYGGGNLYLIYQAMIDVMIAIRDNKDLDAYLGYREDLVEELREEYEKR